MNLSFQTPLFFIVIFIVASFAVSYFLYRSTVPPVSTPKRLLLTGLRGTALTFILLAVCEPLFQFTSTEVKKPTVAVLVDNSLSMSQTDARGNKEHILSTIVHSNALRRLSASTDMKLFSFSHTVVPLIPESLIVRGGSTNISSALRSAEKDIDDLQAIVLISDGNYNAGSNPLYDAEKSHIPIFTLGIGDANEQKDISVSKLTSNSIGYVDAKIPIDAVIRASGIPDQSVSITLTEDGKKIAGQSVDVQFSDGISEIPVQFSYAPKSNGVKKLSVAVSSVNGELTTKNNIRSVLVKVLKNKLNVVVVAGSLSADVSTVMQTLDHDKNINASLFYQTANGELRSREENEMLQSVLTKGDCVIMIGFPSIQTSAGSMQTISRFVESRSLPLLFVAHRTLDMQKVRTMERLFPFVVSSGRIDENTVSANIPEKHKYHQLLQNESASWEKLPPVFYTLQTFSAKPEAQSLVTVKIQNVALNDPLFIVRSIGGVKSAAVLGYGIYRWKLLAGSTDETKDFFDLWFSSIIRWLATNEQDRFVRVEPSKVFFSQGELLDFTGEVYNESYEPVDNADIRLTLRSQKGSEHFETSLPSLGAGRYEGTIENLPEGEFSYHAVALKNGDTLGVSTGRVSVGEQSVEYADTKMNEPLMKQLADISGGRYADADAFESLVNHILSRHEMRSQERVRTTGFELWNLPSFLTIIITLFGFEWLLRKRYGML